jgi:hypothetical protein
MAGYMLFSLFLLFFSLLISFPPLTDQSTHITLSPPPPFLSTPLSSSMSFISKRAEHPLHQLRPPPRLPRRRPHPKPADASPRPRRVLPRPTGRPRLGRRRRGGEDEWEGIVVADDGDVGDVCWGLGGKGWGGGEGGEVEGDAGEKVRVQGKRRNELMVVLGV